MLQSSGLRYSPQQFRQAKQEEQAQPLTFIGMCNVAFRADGTFYTPYGLYKFSSKNGFKREKYTDIKTTVNVGGCYYDHKLHGVSTIIHEKDGTYRTDGGTYYFEWDDDTWKQTSLSDRKVYEDMGETDYDPVTKKVYGFYLISSKTSGFGTIDYKSLTKQEIAQTDSDIACFAINNKGVGYALTRNATLVKVDLATGALTTIAPLDRKVYMALQDMAFDDKTGKLYLVISCGSQTEGLYSGIFEVNTSDATTKLVGKLPEGEEYTCVKVLHEPSTGSPAELSDLKAQFRGSTNQGKVTFTIPTKTVDGQSLSGTVSYTVSLNNNDILTGTAAAGSTQSLNFTSDSLGLNKIVVVLSNEAGSGTRNTTTAWNGADKPFAHNITLSYDSANSSTHVSWDASTGENGGYVDTSAQTFDVIRYPEGKKVATGISASEFSETLADADYHGYYYGITATSNNVTGAEAFSNILHFGKAYDVPYSKTINGMSDINEFDVIDANKDGNTWTVNCVFDQDGEKDYKLMYVKSEVNDADDWAVTAPVHMQKGYAYQVTMAANSISKPERLGLGIGEGTSPETYKTILEPTEISTGDWLKSAYPKANVSIEKDGDYHIGIHALSYKQSRTLMVDSIKVTQLCHIAAPDSIRNLTVTPGSEGELTAKLSFDAPSTTYESKALADFTSIKLYRNGQLFKTINTPTANQHYDITDEDAVNGFTTYSVTASNSKGDGIAVSRKAYIGIDIPTVPQNVGIDDNLDGTATLHWETPAQIGVNGGFVDAADLQYNVYSIKKDGPETLVEGISANSYKIENIEQPEVQSLQYFGVNAFNELGKTSMVQTAMVVGTPHVLPFEEGFTAGNLSELWFYDSSYEDGGFNMYEGMSFDGDNWVTAFMPKEVGYWSTLHSGKISIKGAARPTFAFAYYELPGANNQLMITLRKNGEAKGDTIFNHDFAKAGSSSIGWKTVKVDLSKYSNAEYIQLDFKATVNDAQMPYVIFDDVNVLDMKDNDLTISTKASRHAAVDNDVAVTAIVHNIGDKTATGYKVQLYINDKLSSVADGRDVASFDRQSYTFNFKALRSMPENTKVYAVVAYDSDNDNDNNSSETHDITITRPMLPLVEGLAAESEDKHITLTWTPATTENNVVESFEGYESFLTSNFGSWTTYDRDGENNSSLSGLTYAHSGEPYAWMTFDFGEAGIDLDAYPSYKGHTGTQSVMSIRNNGFNNQDWLISPELNGQAQEISFWIRAIDTLWKEEIKVLASSTGTDPSSFTEVETIAPTNSDWQQYTFQLPAGTKHFAILNNGEYGGLILIDDIAYTSKDLVLKGYKIYRNDELIGTTTANAATYTDDKIAANTHYNYNVTAVYDEGESAYSNDASVTTGIRTVTASDEAHAHASYYSIQGYKTQGTSHGITIIKDNNGTRKVIRR